MRKQIALGAVLALACAGSAMAAEGFSYSNLELSYAKLNLKGTSVDADGFALNGSYGFTENLSVFGGYEDASVDGGGSIKHLNLGVGFNWALNSNLDLTSGLSYENLDFGTKYSGFGLGVGLRGRLGESFEVTGGVKYVDLNKGADGQTTFTVGGRYYFTPAFAVGADYSDQDDLGSSLRLALRYDFGM